MISADNNLNLGIKFFDRFGDLHDVAVIDRIHTSNSDDFGFFMLEVCPDLRIRDAKSNSPAPVDDIFDPENTKFEYLTFETMFA